MPQLNHLAGGARGSATMGAAAAGTAHPDPISLAVGEPAEPPPPEVVEAARRAIVEGRTRYDRAGGLADLRARMAAEHVARTGLALAPEQVVVSAGGKAALMDALRCLLEPGDEVLLLAPFWPSYMEQVRWCGAVPVVVPAADGDVQVEAIEAACTERTRVLVLNSPNNPAGSLLDQAAYDVIADVASRRDLWILSDEVYRAFTFDGPAACPLTARPDLAERTIVVESFSKRFAMTGYRVGAALAPAPVARALVALAEAATTHPATASQHAAVAALDLDGSWEEAQLKRYRQRTRAMAAVLDGLPGVSCAAPRATFYLWPEVSVWEGGGRDLAEHLRDQQGLLVTAGRAFGAEGRVRLSCGLDDARLGEALNRLGALHSG